MSKESKRPSVTCSVRRSSDGIPVMQIVTSPAIRSEAPSVEEVFEEPSNGSSGDESP
jgi:hypothetical protein